MIREIEELSDIQVTNLGYIGDQYAKRLANKEDMVVQVNSDVLYQAFEKAYLMKPHVYYWLGPYRRKLLFEALSGANLIREIALAAYRAGSLIKWFDYIGNKIRSKALGGIKDLLVPVNAVEVAQIRRPRRSALEYVALTMSNKQSLVFMSPNEEDSPGVLFTADSELSFPQQIRWHNHMIITSPHHGSEHNNYAYKRFLNEAGGIDVVWVRSDGKFAYRPGNSYLTVNGRKYCTWCRGTGLPKQNIQLILHNNIWQHIHMRKCQCK